MNPNEQQFTIPQAIDKAYQFFAQNNMAQAQLLCHKILQVVPENAEAIHLTGLIRQQVGDSEGAIAHIQRAVEIQENDCYFSNLGIIQRTTGRYQEAIKSLTRSLELNPSSTSNSNIWYNLAAAFRSLSRFNESIEAYQNAVTLNPKFTEALIGLGDMQVGVGDCKSAIETFRKVISLNPENKTCWSKLQYAKLQACVWYQSDDLDAGKLAELCESDDDVDALALLSFESSLKQQLFNARKQAKFYSQGIKRRPGQRPEIDSQSRIRIGFISGDFGDHPVGLGIVGLLENLDKTRFEVSAYCLRNHSGTDARERIENAVDEFIDIEHLSYQKAAEKIYADNINVLIDLGGYTGNAAIKILAQGPAAIQIGYFGFPSTMGADFMDYIIADKHVVDQKDEQYFSEKLIYMPESFFVCDNKKKISIATPSRKECGLPNTGFVFCAFNKSYKITAAMFDCWLRLLQSVDNSVLWLSVANEYARENLIAQAKKKDIDPTRIIFSARTDSHADHLARYRLADLFLDTFPYNGHTTSAEALWVGCPVLTRRGDTLVSRVASSLLEATGLHELITENMQAYEALARRLATNNDELTAIKKKIADNKPTCALFDTKRTAKDFEEGVMSVWSQYLQNQPVANVTISPRVLQK